MGVYRRSNPGATTVGNATYAPILGLSTAVLFVPLTGAPGTGDGLDGDYAINVTNGNVYGPKAAGVWPGTPLATIGGSGGAGNLAVSAATGVTAYTFAATDDGHFLRFSAGAAITATLSSAISFAGNSRISGAFVGASGSLTIAGSGVTVRSVTNTTSTRYARFELQQVGTTEWHLNWLS